MDAGPLDSLGLLEGVFGFGGLAEQGRGMREQRQAELPKSGRVEL